MKTILLFRHAKSSWNNPSLPDHDRPLAPRGEKAAPRMGAYLRDAGLVPDRVLCSTAHRARQTWDCLAPYLTPSPEVVTSQALYEAGASDLLAALQQLPGHTGRAMLVGHNPGLEDLAAELAGYGDATARRHMAAKYPTAALAEIRFDTASWPEIAPAGGELIRFVKPKDLK